MKKRSYVITILALALMIPLAVSAQEEESRFKCPMGALDLDEEQIEKMEALRMEHRMEMIDLRASLKKLRLKMRMALKENDSERATLEGMLEKMSAIRGKIEKQKLNHLFAVRKILNDDQWKIFLKRHKGDCLQGGHGLHGMRGHGAKGRCPAHGLGRPKRGHDERGRGGRHGKKI